VVVLEPKAIRDVPQIDFVGYPHGSTALKVIVIVTPGPVLVNVIVLTVVDVR
jgi:hypothetical protein